MSNLKAIFIDSPYPHPTFTFSFWKTMYKYGLKKMAMRHLLSLNELGGTLIAYSHPPDEGYDTKYENDESSLEGMLYTSLSLDLDAVKQGKVNILSVLSEQVDLGVVVDVLTGFRALIISDTGFIADDISLCIVDPDTKTVLPSGHIGEVWIRTSNCLTNLFYGLPSLTKQTFDNYLSPSQINTLSKDYNFSVDTYTNDSPTASQSLGEQDVESSVSVDLVKYTRTGVVGFFDTDKTTDVHSRTLLYITCTLKDIATYTCPVSQINEKYSIISNYENADKNQITESDTYEQALVLNNVASDFSIWSFPYIDAIHIRPIKIQDRCLMDILAVVTLDKSLINKLVKCMIKNIRQFLGPDVLLVSIFEKEVINYHPSNNNDIRPEKKAGDLSYLKSLFPGYDSGISTVAKLRKSDVGSNPEKKHDHEFINTNRIDVPSIRLKIRKNIIAPSYVHLNVRVADTLALSSRSNKNLHNVMITPVSLANFSTNDPPYAVSCFQINYMPEQAIEPHLVDHNKNYSTVMVNFDNITDLLVARCRAQGSGRALCLLNENMMIEKSKTYSNIGLNIGAIAHYMLNRTSLKRGARAIVSSSCAYGLLLAVHACLYADIIPIILSPPDKSHSLTSLHIWTRTIVKFKIEYIIVDNKSNDVVKDFLHKLVVDPSIEGLINAISDKIGSFEFPLRVVNINHLSKVGKSYYSKNLSFSRDRLSSSGSQNNEQTHKKDIPPIWGTLCDRILKSDNAETRSSSRISIMDEDLNIKDKDGSVHPTVLILVHPDSHSSNFFIYLSHKVLLKQCSRLAKCFIHQHINDDYRQSESLFSYFFNPHSVENIKPGSLKVRRKLGEKLDNKISVIGCHYRGLGFLYCTMIGIYTGMESILIPSVKYEDTLDLIYRYYSQNEVITTFILKRYLRAIAHRWTENSDTTKDRRLLNKNFVISCDTLNADASIEQFASDINRSVLHNYKIYLAWGSPINPIISIQDSNPKTHQHIKLKSNDIHKNILTVTGISNGSERKDELSDDMSPREVIYVDKGQPAEGSIIIVRDIVTKQILPFGFVGEIWIGSESNARVSIRSTHRKESDRPSKRGIVFDDELFCYHNQKFFIKRTHLHGFLWPLSRVDHAEKSVSVLGGTTAKNSDSISRPQAQGESASSRNRSKSLNVPRDMDSTPYTNIPESDGRRNTVTFGASELEMKNASLFVLSCTKDRILVNGVYYFQKLLELLIEEVYRGPMAGKCVVISIGPNSEPFVILMGMHLYNPDIQSTDDDVGHGLPRANSRSIRKTTNIFALNSATRVLKVLLSEHSIYPSMIAFVPVEAISSNLNSIDFRVSLKNAYMCGDLPIYHLICINDIPECRPGNRVSYSRSFGT